MSKLFYSKSFVFGFLSGLFLFFTTNYFTYLATINIGTSHHTHRFGFPLEVYEWGGYAYYEKVLWFGFIIDIFIAIIFSFIIGLIFKFNWAKISSSRVELK